MAKGTKSNAGKQGPKAPSKNEPKRAQLKNYPMGKGAFQGTKEPDVAYG